METLIFSPQTCLGGLGICLFCLIINFVLCRKYISIYIRMSLFMLHIILQIFEKKTIVKHIYFV